MSAQSEGWLAGLAPDPDLTVSEWADSNRVLSTAESPEPGPWRTDRNPPMREIMDRLSVSDPTTDIAVMCCIQWGKTEILNNSLGYFADIAPGPAMTLQPTVKMAERWSRQRFSKMIESTPPLFKKIGPAKSRDSSNTTLLKEFPGGLVVITGANSAADLRSMPVRFLLMDEVDNYPTDVDGEGDPVALAKGRTSRFGRRKKVLEISSPTIDGLSRIQRSYLEGDQRKLFVPCPHCDELQTLEFENLHWQTDEDGRVTDAYIACTANGCSIENHHITRMLKRHEWRPTAEPKAPNKVSYHINGLYMPTGTVTWSDVVTEYLAAANSIELQKTFKNMRLAIPYKETLNEISADDLKAIATDYPLGRVPAGALLLVAGSDTQDDRQEVYLWGVGPSEQMWLVDYHIVHHEPGTPEWSRELDEYLAIPFPHELGGTLTAEAANIDTGGHHTSEVYNFVRNRKNRWHAIKGASQREAEIMTGSRLIDVNYRGRQIKQGVRLWRIGTHNAKTVLYHRLMKDNSAPGKIHLSKALPLNVFEQLTSEKLNRRYGKNGHPVYEWIRQPGARNEALDCLVYAYHAALRLGCHKWSESRWQELEKAQRAKAQGDLFATDPAISVSPQAPKTQRKPKVILADDGGAFTETDSPW